MDRNTTLNARMNISSFPSDQLSLLPSKTDLQFTLYAIRVKARDQKILTWLIGTG